MYNSDKPSREELPTTKQLVRSTILAFVAAIIILVTVIFPAEYGIDPTGIGKVTGLTEMGEIKEQLAQEAAEDKAATKTAVIVESAVPVAVEDNATTKTAMIEENAVPVAVEDTTTKTAVIVENAVPVADEDNATTKTAMIVENTVPVAVEAPPTPIITIQQSEPVVHPAPLQEAKDQAKPVWRDTILLSLEPGQGAEVKLVMQKGQTATFEWKSKGGPVNYDTHGNGDGRSISYEKGRGVPNDEGELVAAFTGNHGWFFRNRNDQTVIVTLKTDGEYARMKRML
ncbi:hypothetical protein [Veronia pacifica]|uniref:Transmembrane anchor protein n=1 Tax=Veronia pacifica TaxID=1080227 RepID=A0A1C3ET04_9GAMM|nr:hypothetical protein [Veronia pacifica]ODA36283.1 hypothetical protein A8L45_01405 [Veronia pacifica]